MSVTLELKPDLEQRIAAAAAARGLTVEAYLTDLIEGADAVPRPDNGSIEEFEADMDLIAEGSKLRPILADDAFSRESIYADRD
jgi:hypothetical protein